MFCLTLNKHKKKYIYIHKENIRQLLLYSHIRYLLRGKELQSVTKSIADKHLRKTAWSSTIGKKGSIVICVYINLHLSMCMREKKVRFVINIYVLLWISIKLWLSDLFGYLRKLFLRRHLQNVLWWPEDIATEMTAIICRVLYWDWFHSKKVTK